MLYFTQTIYLIPGQEDTFEEFETHALALLGKYNGKLLHRINVAEENQIAGEWPVPHEIHILQFDSEEDFGAFMADESRKAVLHLKDASVERTVLLKGKRLA